MATSRPLRLAQGLWFAGAIATNPTDQTVLVDSGPLEVGTYFVAVQGEGGVAWVYDLQHRDAGNASNQHAQRRRPAAGNEDFILASTFDILQNERFRCVLQGGITGEVQLSLFVQLIL